MSTDFYQRQANARRTTKWLMVMFTVSVICIVAAVFFGTLAAVNYGKNVRDGLAFDHSRSNVDPLGVSLGLSGGTLALIGCGTLFKVAQLRGGGTTVAENLGGYRVPQNTTDPVERRLVNVVEEMALASGVPVPPIYLLKDEQAINAFAAGYSPSDAVVAVTRGTAEILTRDELQGVVAHEFSHILNGDMRLNIRLIGILHGILLMGLIGRMLFNIAARGGGSRRSGKNDAGLYLLAGGATLMFLGLLGTLFGNLIKAAVSRQREYLADASAVQFTRNPEGIAGALKRIGGAIFGSRLTHANAAELSHMYFGQGVWEGFTGLMATHPSLEKRIRILDHHWDGKYLPAPNVSPALTEGDAIAGFAGTMKTADEVPVDVVRHSADQVGAPTQQHYSYAAKLIEDIPNEILDAVREPYGARAVMFALLLDRNAEIRTLQFASLDATIPLDVADLTRKIATLVDTVDARAHLPLVDLALPALRTMTKKQYNEFSHAFKELVAADQQIALFEWSLHRVLLRHLRPQFEKVKPPRIAYYSLAQLGNEISLLLSTLAHLDNTGTRVERSFQHAADMLSGVKVTLLPPAECTLPQLQKALSTLSTVAAKQRQHLVEACAELICYDRDVSIKEAELFRGICDMLECPMPPLLPGQPLSKKRSA